MKRIVLTMGACLLVAVPATMGLVGNTSFAQSVPVRVPSHATLLDDRTGERATILDDNAGEHPKLLHDNAGKHPTHATRPDDNDNDNDNDNGGRRGTPTTRAGHHHGLSGGASAQRGDDLGGQRRAHASGPRDDSGGRRATATTAANHHPGDRNAHRDDNGVHGTDRGGRAGEASGSGHT